MILPDKFRESLFWKQHDIVLALLCQKQKFQAQAKKQRIKTTFEMPKECSISFAAGICGSASKGKEIEFACRSQAKITIRHSRKSKAKCQARGKVPCSCIGEAELFACNRRAYKI